MEQTEAALSVDSLDVSDAGAVGNEERCFGPYTSGGSTENTEAWLSWCTNAMLYDHR
jgi:hypothetical protein